MNAPKTTIAWNLLYATYGLIPIVAGLDKYFDRLTVWAFYLHGAIPQLLNIHPVYCMYGVGIIEILAGVLVFFKPRLGGLVVCAWLITVSLNLIMMGQYYDVAVRDIAMAVGAYVLVLLSQELNK